MSLGWTVAVAMAVICIIACTFGWILSRNTPGLSDSQKPAESDDEVGKWTKKLEHLTAAKRSVWIHFIFMILWLIPGTLVTMLWLSSVVAWVSWMSLYAIVVSHWAGMQAALADLRTPSTDDSGK